MEYIFGSFGDGICSVFSPGKLLVDYDTEESGVVGGLDYCAVEIDG